MIKRSALWITLALAFSGPSDISAFSWGSATAEQQSVSDSGNGPSDSMPDFRHLAKNSTPAVVSIQVKKKRGSSLRSEASSDDAFDFFGDNNIWKFFNLPKEATPRQVSGQASGVIVSKDGYILTNSHVVNEMDSITVLLQDGREFSAKVLGEDTNSDLALIKIDADGLPFLTLADSDTIEPGEWVLAIGNPFGLQATVTKGIVSAKGRNNLDIVPYADFIQTDAALNSGNSGGPLLNLNGEIIGINTAIATNASSGYMGIGFAIPSNWARFVMNEILANGKVSRGFLGITLQSVDFNLARAFDLPKIEGAVVTSVMKDSPADKAGIKPEDVILQYGAKRAESAASLRNGIYMIRPGTKISLTVLREGKTLQIPVEVGAFSEDGEPVFASDKKNSLGIEVNNLTPELAQSLGYKTERGVVVTKVQPGSVAAFAGLKKGALILSVNRKKVDTKEEFFAALRETPTDRPALLQIKQGDVHAFLSLRLQ